MDWGYSFKKPEELLISFALLSKSFVDSLKEPDTKVKSF